MNQATIDLKLTLPELNIFRNLLNQKVARIENDNKNHNIGIDTQYLVLQQYINERKNDYETT